MEIFITLLVVVAGLAPVSLAENDGETITATIDRAFPPEMFAAAYGNASILAVLLSTWKNLTDGANVKDWVDQTPLHLAAKFGKIDAARLLLASGALVNVRNRDFDESPLHLAAKSGYVDMVRLLIEHGADVDAEILTTTYHFPGGTPMTYAIETANSVDTVGLLVKLGGADVNLPNLEKQTPLHLAVVNQNLALIKYLLDSGADIEARDKFGRTPLNHLVLYSKNSPQVPVVAYLLSRGADIESKDHSGRTPFQNSIVSLHKAIAKYLLHQGADINSKGITGRTILHRFVNAGKLRNVEMVKFLLQHGANPNIGTPDGCDKPLHALANVSRSQYRSDSRSDILQIAGLLVSYGAQPQYIEPCSRKSALDLALDNGYILIVEMMMFGPNMQSQAIQHEEKPPSGDGSELAVTYSHIGLDRLEDIVVMLAKMPMKALDERDWMNQSALHVASFFGRAEVVMVLTCFGFDIHAKDIFGRTALINAARIGNTALVEYLLDRNANIEVRDNEGLSPLLTAVKYSSSPATVRFLINRGANLYLLGNDGLSALHIASVNQNFEIMEILLNANLSANIKTPGGQTVLNYLLHSTCCYPQIPTVGLLLKYGADVNAVDNKGFAPIHGAIKSRKGRELILLLLYNGANANAIDFRGCSLPIQLYVRTAADSVSDEQIVATIDWLLKFGASPAMTDHCYSKSSLIEFALAANRPKTAEKLSSNMF